MTQTTQPLTTKELVTEAQQLTTTDFFAALELSDTSTIPTFQELLAKYKVSVPIADLVSTSFPFIFL